LGAAIGLRDLIGWCSISHLCEVNTVPGNHSRSTGERAGNQGFGAALRIKSAQPLHAQGHAQTQHAKQ
jgi:hypothetical protein